MTITAPDRAQGRHLATRSGRIPAISPPHRHELHRQQLIPPLGARQFRWDQPVTSAPRRASCGQGRTLNSAPNRAICTWTHEAATDHRVAKIRQGALCP
jgi:hypothetical protein